MIGSLISSSRIIGANSLVPNSKSVTRPFASILSSQPSGRRGVSSTCASSTRTGSFFRRYLRKENSNEIKESSSAQKNSTLFMSSVAAGVVAMGASTEKNYNSSNATLCADNDDKHAPEPISISTSGGTSTHIFPEEALHHDTYNGVTINLSKLPSDEYLENDAQKFVSVLTNSLQMWRNDGKRGIWINIPTEYSIVVPKCAELGFEFQHAKNGLLVMTKWLPKDQASRLPHGPTHQVGVGVIVVHPISKKMLVVQEKTGPAAGKYKL